MNGRCAGKVAVVTGGAMGMGYATSELLVAEGAVVLIADNDNAAGEAASERLGSCAHFREHDVAEESSWDKLIAWTLENLGGIDIQVNNAGILRTASMFHQPMSDFDQMVAVNLRGTYLGIRSVIMPMKSRGGGVIVNISSAAGIMGVAGGVGYSATKWAVRGMTKSAALELAEYRVRVNSIHPGVIDTPMTAGRGYRRGEGNAPRVPLGRIGVPEEVARATVFLCSEDAAYITGAELVVDAGLTAGRVPSS